LDWCGRNNLILNVSKTKEIIIDFRKNHPSHTPLIINNTEVEVVWSTKFLGVLMTDTVTWTQHTVALAKRVQRFVLPPQD